MQILFVRTGPVLIQTDVCPMTIGGIEAGVYVAARFLSVVFLSLFSALYQSNREQNSPT
jgi:hypothetical protein